MAAGAAEWVWANSRAANGSLLVLMAIAFEADEKGECVMSIAELAIRSRLSARSVPIAVADLVRLGEITVRPKAGRLGRNGYALRLPGDVRSYADSAQEQVFYAESAHLESTGCAESAQVQTSKTAGQGTSCADSALQNENKTVSRK